MQQRLRDEPEVRRRGVEEIIRLASPTALMRTVTRDAELSDQKLLAGDRVLIVFPAGNRDPDAFEDPNRFSLTEPVTFTATQIRSPRAVNVSFRAREGGAAA